MRLSVIVPVFNGRDVLPRCLAGLAGSTRAPDEVIVVDDGSTDESAAIARAHGATVIPTVAGPRGPAWARNRGAAMASGDVLVFVDSDVVVHADTLARMEATFEGQPEVHALFGSYDDRPPAPGIASRFKNLLHHYVHQHGKREASSFWAGCGAIRREAFRTVGGFDESYAKPSIEDIELGVRLFRANLAIRLCPEIQSTHLKRWTLQNLWHTDIFARAVPWTQLLLREARLPDELNLDWRSRASALSACLAATLLVGGVLLAALGHAPGAWPALAAALCLLTSTALNADLHRFFLQNGGLRFAAGAWLLHHAYLLYSSAVFGALVLRHTCLNALGASPANEAGCAVTHAAPHLLGYRPDLPAPAETGAVSEQPGTANPGGV